jgi:hypothetical protein
MRRQFVLGILALLAAFALFSTFSAKPSGCPVEVDRSTEDAQVFLMGTIGGAYEDPNRDCWREDVVQPVLDELGVTYFNPVVSNWTEENAEIEARVIAQAETIVLVITAKHPSIGSLAESGWAVLSAIERGQSIIIYIAPDSSNEESWRARQIVLSQAYPLAENLDNVLIVDSLDELVAALREHYRN